MPTGKEERIKLNVAAINKGTKTLFPSISGSQSARNPSRGEAPPLPDEDHKQVRTSRSGGSNRPGRNVGPPPSGSAARNKVDNLNTLEQKWRTRQAPKNKEELKAKQDALLSEPELLTGAGAAELASPYPIIDAAGLARVPSSKSKAESSRPHTAGTTSDLASHEAEMAALQALLAENDVDAAEAKLEEIIKAASEDGHIDEHEQQQIEQAQKELDKMKARKEDKDRQLQEAEQKAAEHAELQALLAVQDAEAAEHKLKEIIAAAEADGEIDAEEQAEIERARREVAKMREKQEQLRRREAEKAGKAGARSPLGRGREEKVLVSIAAKETAAERLRLATELRELKEKFLKLSTSHHKVVEEKKQVEEALALLTVETQAAQSACQLLSDTLTDKERALEEVREGREAAERELAKTQKLAEARKRQLQELTAAFDQAKLRWEKDVELLAVKEQRAAQLATELQHKLAAAASSAEQLARDNRQLAETTNLEKQSAQLERATCDKYRVRCVDMEEKWSEALQAKEQFLLENQRLAAELADTRAHLDEAGMWHRARVNARRTTRDLLTLPPETQEIQMQNGGLVDDDGVMVAEFLINNLMIVSCDLSSNNIGPTGATALSQALVSNRVLTSLNLKDNPVATAGCEKIATMLMGNRTLERLNLMGCGVGDAGCVALCASLRQDRCPLQLLALRYNGISDVGAEAMARVIEENQRIEEIGLNNNQITDDGIARIAVALATNTTLTLLRLTENPTGRDSLKRLTNAQRPNLHLYF